MGAQLLEMGSQKQSSPADIGSHGPCYCYTSSYAIAKSAIGPAPQAVIKNSEVELYRVNRIQEILRALLAREDVWPQKAAFGRLRLD